MGASFNRKSFNNNNLFSYSLSKLSLNIIFVDHPPSFQKMKFLAIAFLMIVLVGSTFGANYWCGHPRIAANACCWNGEKQSAGWKHSSVNSFPKSCPPKSYRKSVIGDSKLPFGDKCYTCAKMA